MATITAAPGIKTAFSGGADVIVCEFSPASRNGVQIEAEGFTLDDCTIETLGISTNDSDVVTVTQPRHTIVLSTDGGTPAIIRQVQISAVTVGSYFVTFTAI